jgi:hypothetical protein
VSTAAASVVGQDITAGDPAFDGAFVVQAWDPGAVRQKLDGDVRAALLTLIERGEVEVSDRALIVRGVAVDVDALDRCVRAAESLAAAIGW